MTTNGPVRRAQLIAPFGVGAMMILQDGTSVMTAGLDHWFKREPGSVGSIDVEEYELQEWRLERVLRVGHFRLPPDFRLPFGRQVPPPNAGLTVPVLRFPQWHFCPQANCRALVEIRLTERGRVSCPVCHAAGRRRGFLSQVQFVAMCVRGHLRDFPWREWVHRTLAPPCNQTLRLFATGGVGLGAQLVKCDCGVERSLMGITQADPDGSTLLTSELAKEKEYLCDGRKPWLGPAAFEDCAQPIRGSLRGAGNVYFAEVKSAIFLPRDSASVSDKLLALLGEPVYSTVIRFLGDDTKPNYLRQRLPEPLRAFSDSEIERGIETVLRRQNEIAESASSTIDLRALEVDLRRAEFKALREIRNDSDLVISVPDRSEFKSGLEQGISRISLVEKLRETRAFTGFARVFSEDGRSLAERKSSLWASQPSFRGSWLPAYVVFGEGIFIEFDERALAAWELRADVQGRIAALSARNRSSQEARRRTQRAVSPRLVLVHTFSHLLMARLTFECGYGSASLRERLFVSTDREAPMAGVLIYTAAGDSEGTMGGLVRMGRPGILEPIVRQAIDGARWCSADPVCAETKAQGPASLNMAACHSCALVPETACEEFNHFLDRTLVTPLIAARPADQELAFFSNAFRQTG